MWWSPASQTSGRFPGRKIQPSLPAAAWGAAAANWAPLTARAAVPPRIPADRSSPRRDTSLGDRSLSGTDSSNAASVAASSSVFGW
jgi:hypothetical protein